MKKVLPVRIPVYIHAKLVSKGKSYNGIIGNLSQNGVFLETVPTKTVTPFINITPCGLCRSSLFSFLFKL